MYSVRQMKSWLKERIWMPAFIIIAKLDKVGVGCKDHTFDSAGRLF